MSEHEPEPAEDARVRIMRLDALAQGITTGLVCGIGVFVATNWLLLKGGPVVGPNLALLGQFFLGYQVTFAGSVIGFAWAFVYGGAAGYAVGRLYNWVVGRR
jgi:hypothetical protein